MSEPTVLVIFRLDRETPIRVRWFAEDGVPGDRCRPQGFARKLSPRDA